MQHVLLKISSWCTLIDGLYSDRGFGSIGNNNYDCCVACLTDPGCGVAAGLGPDDICLRYSAPPVCDGAVDAGFVTESKRGGLRDFAIADVDNGELIGSEPSNNVTAREGSGSDRLRGMREGGGGVHRQKEVRQ